MTDDAGGIDHQLVEFGVQGPEQIQRTATVENQLTGGETAQSRTGQGQAFAHTSHLAETDARTRQTQRTLGGTQAAERTGIATAVERNRATGKQIGAAAQGDGAARAGLAAVFDLDLCAGRGDQQGIIALQTQRRALTHHRAARTDTRAAVEHDVLARNHQQFGQQQTRATRDGDILGHHIDGDLARQRATLTTEQETLGAKGIEISRAYFHSPRLATHPFDHRQMFGGDIHLCTAPARWRAGEQTAGQCQGLAGRQR